MILLQCPWVTLSVLDMPPPRPRMPRCETTGVCVCSSLHGGGTGVWEASFPLALFDCGARPLDAAATSEWQSGASWPQCEALN